MPSCWTCGAPTQTASHRCPECKTVVALDAIENKLEAGFQGEQLRDLAGMSTQFAQIAIQKAQWQAMNELAEATNRGFRRVCDAIRWSTTEISWRLDQQQETLKSIDNTLKTPSETQANEFRQMAERLVERGVLEDAREFYEKALNLNRLDFRTYVGLADVLVKQNAIARAIEILTRSLPHAPKAKGDGPIRDYRSLSLRLIARGQECLGNFAQAETSLEQAVELSPEYHDARYDFARLNCLTGKEERFAAQLSAVIESAPIYWHFAREDVAFRKFTPQLKATLSLQLRNVTAEIIKDSKQMSCSILELNERITDSKQQCYAIMETYQSLPFWQKWLIPRSVFELASTAYTQAENHSSEALDQIRNICNEFEMSARRLCAESQYAKLRNLQTEASQLVTTGPEKNIGGWEDLWGWGKATASARQLLYENETSTFNVILIVIVSIITTCVAALYLLM